MKIKTRFPQVRLFSANEKFASAETGHKSAMK